MVKCKMYFVVPKKPTQSKPLWNTSRLYDINGTVKATSHSSNVLHQAISGDSSAREFDYDSHSLWLMQNVASAAISTRVVWREHLCRSSARSAVAGCGGALHSHIQIMQLIGK